LQLYECLHLFKNWGCLRPERTRTIPHPSG
jgi:hypothetical protein